MNVIKRTFGFIHQHPLGKKHLVKAYSRFIYWQIKSRLNPNLHEVPFLENVKFLAKRGLTGVTGNIYTGLHEFNDMGFLLHFLRNEDTFYDVGANVGSYTLLASGVCRSKTIAFEPVPATCSILKNNIKLNRLENLVTIENKGVGSKDGELYFTNSEDTTNHIVLEKPKEQNTILVPVVNLDQYYPTSKPSLIKIDVEGFETEVLNGMDKSLKDPILKAIIIELNGSGMRYGYNEDKIHEKLIELDFKPYEYDPFTRELNIMKRYGSLNTIYARDIDYVLERVKKAKHFKIFNQLI